MGTRSKQATPSPVTGFAFPCIYVSDLAKARRFYERYLGFVAESTLDDGSLFGAVGPVQLWLGGGFQPVERSDRSVRTAPMFHVGSASSLFAALGRGRVRRVQKKPQDMGGGRYWFQFFDPAGNMLEVLGGP